MNEKLHKISRSVFIHDKELKGVDSLIYLLLLLEVKKYGSSPKLIDVKNFIVKMSILSLPKTKHRDTSDLHTHKYFRSLLLLMFKLQLKEVHLWQLFEDDAYQARYLRNKNT